MAVFEYLGVQRSGRRTNGNITAATATAAQTALETSGLVVLKLKLAELQGGGQRLTHRQLLAATRSIAALINAGVPIVRALKRTEAITDGRTAVILGDLRTRVQRGESLVNALGAYPRAFPPAYRGLIAAGIGSGDLATAFTRIGDQLEREHELRNRLRSAAIYPLLLAAVGVVAIVLLVTLVLPRFAELLQGTGTQLPATTALLLRASEFLRRYWALLTAAAVALTGACLMLPREVHGRRLISIVLRRVPVISSIYRRSVAGRFARITSMLVRGGVPLLPAIGHARESFRDPLTGGELREIEEQLRNGQSLHSALSRFPFFGGILVDLAAVGEETGRLGEFLGKSADILEDETQQLLQRLVTLAEPAMIIGFGSIIAFVALSLLQAIYSVNAGSFR